MTVEINFSDLDRFRQQVGAMPKIIDEAANLAVQESGRFAFRESSKEIRAQVNFERNYIGSEASGGDRLRIERGTRGGEEFVRLVARDRPTSLARFIRGTATPGRPVRVAVSPAGGTRSIPGAFVVKLRRGKTLTEDNFNEGLAVRFTKSATIRERHKGKAGLPEIFPGVFLLYGPSVAQVFNTVADDVKPRVGRKLESEFLRQFNRLMKAAA
jgi:hypothetical protein